MGFYQVPGAIVNNDDALELDEMRKSGLMVYLYA